MNAPGNLSRNLLRAAQMLYEGDMLTSAKIRRRFGVSKATAKRYIHHLEIGLPVQVELRPTHGKPQKVLRLEARAC